MKKINLLYLLFCSIAICSPIVHTMNPDKNKINFLLGENLEPNQQEPVPHIQNVPQTNETDIKLNPNNRSFELENNIFSQLPIDNPTEELNKTLSFSSYFDSIQDQAELFSDTQSTYINPHYLQAVYNQQPQCIDPRLLHADYDTTQTSLHTSQPIINQNINTPVSTLNKNQTTNLEEKERKSASSFLSEFSDKEGSGSEEEVKSIMCPIEQCSSSHDNQIELIKHLIQTHKKYPCRYQVCRQRFKHLNPRLKHEASEHRNDRKSIYALLGSYEDNSNYHCNTSGCPNKKTTKFTRQDLLTHLETNHPNRKSICDICLFSYKDNDGMRRHIKVQHIGQKIPCRYPDCTKTFPYRSAQHTHEKKHHGGLYTRRD